ncbi:short chain enoyl-CoA hydratase /3-hydroxyacyl-CoA dehydrogenase [Gemmobacter megaterium]|uniref:Short chain enoyl-CoA hydratase /3-hydroxyacyl-CoA dehydrogenase n=1 Tax=Gemmobacter megaterium TaxID=1086013 RepID=A0A1N7LMD2_9RHOB|nr:3-hydroxyacyl-CoA dehydrogenase NAD-binding domain-containing protein [Gemmobacter megaterium]GGE11750.1 3-hydroxyacyl-CoA dehydrogenase [Gemmobacter megaterium]SIS74967.1 short chain enoyl-CoA hydratase /3-hydroxyacyl-CoA dehydrogenase [Gemmobacter megaterium]
MTGTGTDYSVQGGIAVIRVDNPPVNALGSHVRLSLNELMRRAEADAAVRGVILTGTGKVFVAGADLKQIDAPRSGPSINDLLAFVEGMTKPVVAALQGLALGGGYEIAMGCHARIAAAGVRVGLPETTLGLIPGAGGTQRLPRLVGAAAALDLIASGRQVAADEALRLGMVDAVTSGDLLAEARGLLDRVPRPLPRLRDRTPQGPAGDLPSARAAFEARAVALGQGALPAIRAAIAAVRDSFDPDFDAAIAREHAAFHTLRTGPEARAMIHAFLAERASAHVAGVSRATPRLSVAQVSIIGAGTMGGGIGITCANAGYTVTMVETSAPALEAAKTRIEGVYIGQVSRDRLTPEAAAAALARFRWVQGLEAGVAGADLVIEAVFEDMGLKKEVFAQLDRLAPPSAILASNTSYQNIDELAAVTQRPDRVVGMHYFSPANVMKLLEIVRGAATSPETLATVLDLARKTGKIPVVVGVCYGFVGNRMLWLRTVQTQRLLLEGCSPRQVDTVLTDFGFRMGPCQMGDMAGLDVAWRLRKARGERMEPVDTLADAGRWGQKTGKGWYLYPDGARDGVDDPALAPVVAEVAARLGVTQRAVSAAEIEERLLYPLINEGTRILEEGIVERAGDIDVIYLHGYGWPRHRGGPMQFADARGLPAIVATLDRMAEAQGDDTLRPSALLRRLAATGGRLID